MIPKKRFLYFITDASNRSCYFDGSAIQKTNIPTPLSNTPDGWKDVEIAFGTNDTYFSLQRSFTVPLKFVGDGAKVLRYYMQNGKGYEEELYIVILKWAQDTGIYKLEYKGRIDLSKYSDDPKEGVTLNAIEGGILDYLSSRADTAYDILCDTYATDYSKVEFDGTLLLDRFYYQQTEDGTTQYLTGYKFFYSIPTVYEKNDGDSVGVTYNDSTLFTGYTGAKNANFPNAAEMYNGEDFIFQSLQEDIKVNINGVLSVQMIYQQASYNSNYVNNRVYGFSILVTWPLLDGSGYDMKEYEIQKQILLSKSQLVGFNLSQTIDVPVNGKVFLMMKTTGASNGYSMPIGVQFKQSDFTLSFNSKAINSSSVVLSPLQLLKAIVNKMTDGKFTAESNFFTQNDNIVATCGDSIRNTAYSSSLLNYYLNTSFNDWFQSYNSIYNLGFKVIDNVLWVEPKADLYGGDTILDIGEVSSILVETCTDYLCNTINSGYPAQDYDAKSGKYEFNSEAVWTLPVTTVEKNYDIRSKYRGDAFGIEFIRANLTSTSSSSDTDTTDNEGDTQVFLINTEKTDTYKTFSQSARFSNSGYIWFPYSLDTELDPQYPLLSYYQKVFSASRKFTVSGSANNNGSFYSLGINGVGAIDESQKIAGISVTQNVIDETATLITITFDNPLRTIRRANYTSINGVLDNTVYNVEDMTPKRQVLAHGNYLRSLLYQLPSDSITLSSKDKNQNLVTILNGKTISENASEIVNSLADPLFLPYIFEFTTKVPLTFTELFNAAPKGLIKFSYNGHDLYALPIGTMKYKPATEETQSWKVLCSAKTELNTLFNLSDSGLLITEGMQNSLFISDLNPVQFIRYGFTLNAKYHTANAYKLPFRERITRFMEQPKYVQKWQTNDTINLQFITYGLPTLEIQILDHESNVVSTKMAAYIDDTALTSPYQKQQISIPLGDFEEGIYVMAIMANGTCLAYSECMNIAEDWPETLLFEYYNSLNRLNGYFASWRPSLRCEGLLMPTQPESEFTTYQDDQDNNRMLWGISTPTKVLYIGNQYGVPDWMALKLNEVLLLDRVAIESDLYAKQSDSKFSAQDIEGYPMSYYSITLSQYGNKAGLDISDTVIGDTNQTAVYTLDASAFGQAEGVISTELKED
ncbi:hypothetical protein [Rhizosphaericola mali]|uniref:Uncharacterized protein n=1 Tax=Rhizosphaericola mali TaxID=2545455 RepID=A0A5P2G6M0_9BACT|nr:hypothetical protein [Rhizosphaericola mali]QES88873.1 hypothetical protein E0W69_009465 [Rhizosphaericola mali]